MRFWLCTILLIGLYGLFACGNDKKQIEGRYDTKVLNQEQISNVEMYYSDSAEIKLKITSDKMIRYTDGGRSKDEFPEGLTAEFLNKSQRVVSKMNGGYALRDDKSGEVVIRKDVVCVNGSQDRLYTSELYWDEANERLHTKKFVKITRPLQGDTIMGHGLVANRDFTRFELENKVSGKLSAEDLDKALK